MADPTEATDRLAGVISRLDIALVLHAAGIDARSFSTRELDSLNRTLIVATRRGRQAGPWPAGDPL
jgi:hypothetical protein